MIPSNYLEKIYSGYLGMNIGIRLGAPVEPTIWTYERIQSTYGEITDYVKEFKTSRPTMMRTVHSTSCARCMTMRKIAILRLTM